MPPARYAPAAGTAKATCAPTARLRAGRPAPTSPTFIPSRAAPCRAPCGGSSKRRNSTIGTAPRPFRPGRGGRKNPGAAVAAPGVPSQQPNQNPAAFAVAQATELEAPQSSTRPSKTGGDNQSPISYESHPRLPYLSPHQPVATHGLRQRGPDQNVHHPR